ncbi:MAG: HEPN domain-containing protein [Alphaproteobacteria bacterium]|nr:HEPN domain-containing protein [Alphaproteobacteria bacterium]
MTSNQKLEFCAPMHNFFWEGDDFELAPGIWIRRKKGDLSDEDLTEYNKKQLRLEEYWLWFEWMEATIPSAGDIISLSLLSLWLTKPTKAFVAYYFCIMDKKHSKRLLDRFMWVPGNNSSKFSIAELKTASMFYEQLNKIYHARGRLNNAMVMTLTGCRSHYWQAAFICCAAAVEGILTYESGRGITKRLAKSYACLTEQDAVRRDAAYKEFEDLYSIRSDVMHGRIHEIPANNCLPMLSRFQNLLRKLWQKIMLESPNLIAVLENNDAERGLYFKVLQKNYMPPPSCKKIGE